MFLLILIAVFILLFAGYFIIFPKQKNAPIPNINTSASSKKVVFIAVDSLMEQPLQEVLKSEDVPSLKFFMENGHYYPELISSYPTMSVTIDSTLLTGTYADQHKIPGLVWYNQSENRIISYGNSPFENIKLGISNFIKDCLYELNNADLSTDVETIHEHLHKNNLSSASINGLIYRGNTKHILSIPRILNIFPKIPNTIETKGPDLFSFGNLKRLDLNKRPLLKKYGMGDKSSIRELTYLIKQNLLPSFTLVYLPDNDWTVHFKGPDTLKGLKKIDKHLQNLLDVFPSWDDALKEITWVLIGDSAQSWVAAKKSEALIKLKNLLGTFQIAKIGDIKADDEIVFTANERMAYIYALQDLIKLSDIRDKLLEDDRIAFISWREQDTIHVDAPGKNEELTFKKGGTFTDEYQQSWELQGDYSILDLTIQDDGTIKYGDYPDGLARLFGAMNSHEGRFLIAEAKPGYEFKGESSPTHDGGGAHGSMHAKDSVAPIIIAGTDELPENYRVVDMKKWVLKLVLGNSHQKSGEKTGE